MPQSIIKPIDMSLVAVAEGDYMTVPLEADEEVENLTPEQRQRFIAELEAKMREAARRFEFEQAAQLARPRQSAKGAGQGSYQRNPNVTGMKSEPAPAVNIW